MSIGLVDDFDSARFRGSQSVYLDCGWPTVEVVRVVQQERFWALVYVGHGLE